MGHKWHVTDYKMSVTLFADPKFAGRSAKAMARALLRKEHQGPGDTIEAAAHRIERKHGVAAEIILQGWNRPPRGMMAARWLPLFYAWCRAGLAKCSEKADQAYEAERARHDELSALVRLADLVAGRKMDGSAEEEVMAASFAAVPEDA